MLPMRHPSSCGRSILSTPILCFVFLCTIFSFASAQLVNGQFFTRGLAISDSPAPQSQNNAGGNLNIAVELSGDGKLSQDAFLPTSTSPTAYQSLNIYLVSSETNVNLSVTTGPQFLQQEPGSTVKHLTWPIPACVPSGNYNLTYYELSRIDDLSYYSITPIPIVIKSQSTAPCSDATTPIPQPQDSSPPPQQPWFAPSSSAIESVKYPSPTSGSSSTQLGGAGTVPNTSSSVAIIPNPSSSGIITITLSASPTTVTFISTVTAPTTISGSATVFTTLTTMASVTTVVSSGSGGVLLPVNGAIPSSLVYLPFLTLWVSIVICSVV